MSEAQSVTDGPEVGRELTAFQRNILMGRARIRAVGGHGERQRPERRHGRGVDVDGLIAL